MPSRPAHTGEMRVLVVEDHATLAARVAQGLRQAGMAVDVVHDGAAALQFAARTGYDVIVLDRDLPVVHGDRVCREVAGSGPRILMLTAAGDRARHRASRCSRPLSHTRKGFGILGLLLAGDGAVVSAEELLRHVWDGD